MFKKKNVLIGLVGLSLTILFFVLFMNSNNNNNNKEIELFVVLAPLSLVLFFIGFIIGGFHLGGLMGLYIAAFCGIMAAPNQIKGPLFLLFFGAIILGPKLLEALRKMKSHNDDIDELKESQESENEMKAVFKYAVYLIMPRKFKSDVTYKVVNKGDFIYFCRCGGQFYQIDQEIAKNANLSDNELLSHKDSFKIKKDEVNDVEVKSKIRYWTGNIPNNGSVNVVAEQKLGFIIHAINNYTQVQDFFESALNCPVIVSIDQKRKLNEDVDAEFENQDKMTKSRIRKISAILNTAGTVVGLWLIFYPRPLRLAVCVGIILPIFGLLFYAFHEKLVSFDEGKYSSVPSVITSIVMPALALTIIGLVGFNIIYNGKLWIAVIFATIIISVMVLLKTRKRKKEKSVIFILPIIVFVYCYGAIITSNCLFDYNEPTFYSVEALEKEHNVGSNTSEYALIIAGWNEKDTVKVSVTERIYNATDIGQNVRIAAFQGLWGIEWFVVQSP